ncbi:MAG: hypothetical protein HP497_04795 [Nitrospira sp.]|nr:hypothetical protein [Nitrospira sp.]
MTKSNGMVGHQESVTMGCWSLQLPLLRLGLVGTICYLTFYNQIRPHRALDGRTPDGVYWKHVPAQPTAA